MIWTSGWKLASAVSNAGGLGILGAGSMYPDVLKEHIIKCKKATSKPFGVNVPLLYPDIDKLIEIIIAEDIKNVLKPVLSHRLILSPDREMEGMKAEDVVDMITQSVEIPR